MGILTDWAREGANLFWDSARRHHLDELLEDTYRSEARKKIVRAWTGNTGKKSVLIRQINFNSDPLLIVFGPEGFEIGVLDNGEQARADVEIQATHTAIICDSSAFIPCARAWINGKIKVPGLWSRPRDHYYAARIFLS
jgi:hypothetical protein